MQEMPISFEIKLLIDMGFVLCLFIKQMFITL